MTIFEQVAFISSDPILGLNQAFLSDKRVQKVNLGVGIYKNKDLKTPILKVVKDAERKLLEAEETKDYLPIDGHLQYLSIVAEIVFGKDLSQLYMQNLSSVQTIGGTGALKISADFLKYSNLGESVHIPDPSWPNHKGVFNQSGFSVHSYPYYDRHCHSLDFSKMMEYLSSLPNASIVVFHACCHNPTGADPTIDQWQLIAEVCLQKRFIPIIDAAYLGLGEPFDEDCRMIRLFIEKEVECLIAISFSKTFSLYSERVGDLYVFAKEDQLSKNILSQLKLLIRRNYSNPPLHGASIVASVLSNTSSRREWEIELAEMRERILEMKKAFTQALMAKTRKKNYHYLLDKKGMFCFSGLTKAEAEQLMKEYAIYMTLDGRINIAGLNWDNMDYVIDAIVQVSG